VLVDGRVAAMWSVERAGAVATLVVTPVVPVTRADRDAVAAEGAGLVAFLAADADDHDVRIEPGP